MNDPPATADGAAPALLAIHPGALGDVVLALRVLASLKGCFAVVDLIAQCHLGRLAESLGEAQCPLPVESALFATLFTDRPDDRLKALLQRYDTVLVFSVSGHLARSVADCTDARVVAVAPRPPARRRIHVQDHLFQQLADRGLALPPVPHRRCRRALSAPGRLLIHPGASSARKRLAPSAAVAAARLLAEDGWRPEYVLGPSETDLAPVIAGLDAEAAIETITDIGRLRRRLEAADALVGNDSGVSHLAAFLGLPTVAVFGPTDPRGWNPEDPRHVALTRQVPCSPCDLTHCPVPGHPCLDELPPTAVAEAVAMLLARTAPAKETP